MREKFNQLKSKKYTLVLFLSFVVFIPLHLYQFFDSGYMIYPLIRVIAYTIMAILLFFIGEKSLPYTFAVYGLVLGQTITFENYTAFLVIYIASCLKKKIKIPLYALYCIDVLIVCTRHDKSAVHYIIHILSCVMFYIVMTFFIDKMINQTKLKLTPDEEYILEELVFNDRKQKEIEGYQQNTVAKKLKVCREKNNCINNEELYEKYRSYKINKLSTSSQ